MSQLSRRLERIERTRGETLFVWVEPEWSLQQIDEAVLAYRSQHSLPESAELVCIGWRA